MPNVRDSGETRAQGYFLLPSKLNLPTLITLATVFLGIVIQAVRAEQRLSSLEDFRARAEARREVEDQALRRMEKILCRMCDAQLGRESCDAICTE